MKNSILVVLIIVLIFCTACMQNEQTETNEVQNTEQITLPSVEIQPTVLPSSISNTTPEPIVTDKEWPELIWAGTGEYIPDRIQDVEYESNSNATFYEDEEYIYYLKSFQGDLIYIGKKDGEIKTITNDCWDFTVYKSKVYYIGRDGVEDETAYFNCLEVYDVKADTNIRLIKSEESLCDLACYKDKLFYTSSPDFDLNEQGCVLFSVNLDGTEVEKFGDDVDTFCIYEDNIYIITTGDLGFLHKYDFENSVFKKVYTGAVSYDFDFSLNRIFCYEYKETRFNTSNILAYDISTGGIKGYSPYMSNNVAGQYIIFKQKDENNHLILKAYDFIEEKGYILLDITNIVGEDENSYIHITPENIYLCIEKSGGIEIYVVLIHNGQVNSELVTTITTEG